MSDQGKENPKDVYAEIKLENKPLSSEEKDSNSANVIKGAEQGLGEALGDLLGSLGKEDKKDDKK